MVKDRTDQLVSGKRVKKKNNEERDLEAGEESDEETSLNPKWTKPVVLKAKNKECQKLEDVFKKVNDIIVSVEGLKENIVQLQKKHVLLQRSTRVEPVLKEEAEELNEEIKKEANLAKQKIKDLEQNKTGHPDSAIDRVIKTQTALLTQMLQEAVEFYDKSLQAHKQFCESLIKKQLHIVIKKVVRRVGIVPAHKEVTEDELMAIIDTEDTAVFVEDYIKETTEARQLLQDARDRHKEILAIERDILKIRDMFCDLALNITKQGEMIDTIEYHIGNGIIMTNKGNKRLFKANKMRQGARRRKIYLIICLSSVIAILLISLVSSLGF
ncbi:syntaxin-like isoform X1 [Cimex lectularius]|uniref:t-SNARE coiled-coil homology domain-containing protein n=1 Tax=Cimex lectularius TaxID=79782 RepID=A0A8I6TCX7_CIMLE|nr:syntaxin-like isoform X1 [Cimex lectularius]